MRRFWSFSGNRAFAAPAGQFCLKGWLSRGKNTRGRWQVQQRKEPTMYQSLAWSSSPAATWRHVSLERIEGPARACGSALPELLALCVGLVAKFS